MSIEEDEVTERTYDYPAKNEVREAWMRFLPEFLQHPNDCGLYLPSVENLEFDGYCRKGIKPHRLIGAEHDSLRFDEARKNSQGIQLVHGNLLDAFNLIESSRLPRLRFANLDFDGNQHTFTEELMALARVFPSSRGSYLAVTSYAARDKSALVQGIINACKFYSGLPSTSVFTTQYGQILKRFELLTRLIPYGESTAHAHFQRELGLLWWIVLMLCVIDPPESGTISVFDQRFIDDLDAVLVELTREVEAKLSETGNMAEILFVARRELRDIMSKRTIHYWVTDMRRFAYWSDNRQPMRTWFFRVLPLDGLHETAQNLLEQVWNLASRFPLIYIDSEGNKVTIE